MQRPLDLQPRKNPVQDRAKATHLAIVQATARILERDGYEALTTNKVAYEAGIAIASLYEYFPNKHAVVAAAVTVLVEDVIGEIEGALGVALLRSPEAGLSIWIGAMFDALAKRRGLTAAMIRGVPFLREIPVMRSLRPRLLELAARAQVIGTPGISGRHLDATLYLLPMMVSSAVLEAVTSPPSGLSRAEIEAALVDMLGEVLFRPRAESIAAEE